MELIEPDYGRSLPTPPSSSLMPDGRLPLECMELAQPAASSPTGSNAPPAHSPPPGSRSPLFGLAGLALHDYEYVGPTSFVTRERLKVRSGVELASSEAGSLRPASVLCVQQTARLQDGTERALVAAFGEATPLGWISMHARDGRSHLIPFDWTRFHKPRARAVARREPQAESPSGVHSADAHAAGAATGPCDSNSARQQQQQQQSRQQQRSVRKHRDYHLRFHNGDISTGHTKR